MTNKFFYHMKKYVLKVL